MTINSYYLGQKVRITNTITVSSTATTPTGLTFKTIDPVGTATTYTSSQMTNSSTGVYYVDITTDTEGVYRYLWTATGTGAGATEGQFTVLDTPFN